MPHVKLGPSSLLQPENRDRKSGSQTGLNLHFRSIFQIYLPFVLYNYSGFMCQVKTLYWAHFCKNRMSRKVLQELWPKT